MHLQCLQKCLPISHWQICANIDPQTLFAQMFAQMFARMFALGIAPKVTVIAPWDRFRRAEFSALAEMPVQVIQPVLTPEFLVTDHIERRTENTLLQTQRCVLLILRRGGIDGARQCGGIVPVLGQYVG